MEKRFVHFVMVDGLITMILQIVTTTSGMLKSDDQWFSLHSCMIQHIVTTERLI